MRVVRFQEVLNANDATINDSDTGRVYTKMYNLLPLLNDMDKNDRQQQKRIQELEKQNHLLKECVEFYGDHMNWTREMINSDSSLVECLYSNYDVGGKKARETLKQIEQMEKW